jgi:hypothetical protein
MVTQQAPAKEIAPKVETGTHFRVPGAAYTLCMVPRSDGDVVTHLGWMRTHEQCPECWRLQTALVL